MFSHSLNHKAFSSLRLLGISWENSFRFIWSYFPRVSIKGKCETALGVSKMSSSLRETSSLKSQWTGPSVFLAGHSVGSQWSKAMFVSWKSVTLCIPNLFHKCPCSFCKFPHCLALSGSVTWVAQSSARTHSAAERVFKWLSDWRAEGFRLCHQKNSQVLACMGNNSEAMPLHDQQKLRTHPNCRDVKIKSQVGL